MQKNVLVVGEDPGLRREIESREGASGGDYQFECVRTGAEALAKLNQSLYTAVIAEWRLPGEMPGHVLLNEALRQQPECLRFVRSDLTDHLSSMRCIGSAHRFLIHPTDLQTIRYALDGALAVATWLPTSRVHRLMSSLGKVPSPPQVYFEVVSQLESPLVTLEEIGETIGRDPAITAKMLQLVNSAVFGLQLHVSHPTEAIGFLGLEATRSLVLLAHTFSHFDDLVNPGFSVESLWQHSYSTARCSRWIAEAESRDPDVAAQTFTAGLLHDLGKLVLAANLPTEFQQAVQRATDEQIELWQAEFDVLGTHHAEVGACLLAIWGLPSPIVTAVGLHHRPATLDVAEFSPLAAVHVANVFAQSVELNHPRPALPELDMEYLQASGNGERVAEWSRVISEMGSPSHAVV